MIKVGLTGGIASGKTTVSDWLRARRYPLIDADRIAREVVAPGEPGLSAIAGVFGQDIILKNGTLDRQALGRLIFNDEKKRRQLNELLHPLIWERIGSRVKQFRESGARAVFLDIPLLFEGSLDRWTDKTLVVYVSKDNQLRRLMSRNHFTETEALARIDAQMSLEEKKKMADAVIDNNGSVEETVRQLQSILKQWNLL